MSNTMRNAGLGAIAVMAVGTVGAAVHPAPTQAVAEWLAGDAPDKPEKKIATRGPVHVAMGIDGSASKIRHKVGTAMDSTADFIENGGLLGAGDTVKFCEVGGEKGGKGEPVHCADYTLPADQAGLLADIRDTKSTHWSTHVLRALDGMNDLEAPCAMAVWTDAITEEKDDGYPAPVVDLGECELKVLIPDAEYMARAKAICASVEQKDQCTVVEASSGKDVTAALSGVVGEAQAEAQKTADAAAQVEFDKAMVEYEKQLETRREEAKKWQGRAQALVGGVSALALSLLAAGVAYLTKPVAKGYVYLLSPKGKFRVLDLEAESGKGTVNLKELDSRYPALTFQAKRGGKMLVNNRPVSATTAPVEIAPGVYYSEQSFGKKTRQYAELEAAVTGESQE